MTEMPNQLCLLPESLLRWYGEHRRRLPWREEVSPYRTWVSEIMLQQTRVTAVLPYFSRFTEAYPSVCALADADEEDLMRLWQGLGYYSRARNLQKAARILCEQYDGQFPDTYEELIKLPGIGDYTAGAILSIAMGKAVPAVDGNVLRVISRITGFDGDVLDPKNRAMLRSWMAGIIPPDAPAAFNQALMDLGAMVCTPNGVPDCAECPARDFCRAHALGKETSLPVRTGKREKRVEHLTVFILKKEGTTALRQRPKTGLLAGLWEFPHVPGTLSEREAAAQLEAWGLAAHRWNRHLTATHEFTHIRWEMSGFVVEVRGAGDSRWSWCSQEELQHRAIPSAFAKFVSESGE